MTTSTPPKKKVAKAAPLPESAMAKTPTKRWWLIGAVAGILLVASATVTGIAYAQQAKTIVRSTTILGQPVGALDSLSALTEIEAQWVVANKQGLVFTYQGEEYAVPLDGSASEEKVILDIVQFSPAKAVDQAFSFGHEGPVWKQAWQRLSGWLGRRHEFGTIAFSEEDLVDLLRQQLGEFEKNPVSAGLTYDVDSGFSVTPSATGQSMDYAAALRTAKRQLRSLSLAPIPLRTTTTQPTVASSEALTALAATEAPATIALAPVRLTYGEKSWAIEKDQLANMLGFARGTTGPRIGIDPTKFSDYLGTIKKEIEIEPKDAKFSLKDGKVIEFQTSQIGKLIDVEASLVALDLALQTKQTTAALVVVEKKPLTDTIGANNLGITELVAEGKSSFKGSPTNRRFNLTYGSEILNGLLIKPGETFSLVTALGPIDGKHGWKPELVIKQGGKITPEFGGGLCQVATTLFRAALYAGLPIVERRNHSLRISYYEPPIGLDATIYEPKPDLRFTNDYAGYLLLQTEVAGDDLIFRFYGVKDGRVVDLPEPKVYNKTGIPPTITIETTELKPGEKECQAPGHPGADATATYTVTKPGQEPVTQIFQSHYKAIGVICRVGKAAEKKKKSSTAPANETISVSTVQ